MFKIRNHRLISLLVLVLAIGLLAGCSGTQTPPAQQAGEPATKDVILATTTSTQDSGLLDVLKPIFEQKTGYVLKPIAVGTGAALTMGEKGEADVMLVHAPADEVKLVESGAAINRQLVMHNDFLIVGPENDPAKIKGTKLTADALKKISETKSIFVSRGDDSGTHKMEKNLWKAVNIEPKGEWYQQAGAGMGQTLTVASEKSGYTLTDRGTYLAQKGNLKLIPLVEGDKVLLNIYHVMQVNPEKHQKINAAGGKAFVDFMVAPETQKIIETFGVDKFGQPLFFPDAGKNEADLGK